MSFSWYGVFLGLAIVVLLSLVQWVWQRARRREPLTDLDLFHLTLFMSVPALIGARLSFVFAHPSLFVDLPWWNSVAFWQGGMGIFGAVAGGVLGLWLWTKLHTPRRSFLALLEAFALALPFAQAIGRLGNFANQELFGPPTTAPWGIFIDIAHRPEMFRASTHFHPLFAYEALAMLGLGTLALALWHYSHTRKLDRLWPNFTKLGSGTYLGLYLFGYGIVRFFLEFLRLETTWLWYGLRPGQLASLLMMLAGLALLAWTTRNSSSQLQ